MSEYVKFSKIYLVFNNWYLNSKVDVLYVHEPGQVRIVYPEGDEDYVAENQAKKEAEGYEKETQLTAFFTLMKKLKPDERIKYRYDTVTKDFHYDKEAKEWKRRIRQVNRLLRVGSAAPGNRESQVQIFITIFWNL